MTKLPDHDDPAVIIEIVMPAITARTLVRALQLALRHTALQDGHEGAIIRKLTQFIIDQLANGNQMLRQILDAGFDPANDVETERRDN